MKKDSMDFLFAGGGVGPCPIFTALGEHYLRRDSVQEREAWQPLAKRKPRRKADRQPILAHPACKAACDPE